jgi:hypothetical protein
MTNKYPLRHLSIRVPWHDAGWIGCVCNAPKSNDACLKLRNISRNRDDKKESGVAGRSISELKQNQWPCCVTERSTFMAPFEFTRMATHPYVELSPETHGHFDETPFRHPAYSAPALPFRWMLSENMEMFSQDYGLSIDPNLEPRLRWGDTDWVQAFQNQKALSDCFFNHIREEESLVFFYAKRVPLVDNDARRVIVGVGRVKHVQKDVTEYKYSRFGPLKSALWERSVQHSIRPGFKDGFLIPYHEALKFAEDNPSFDPSSIVAFAPDDRREEFSYASEHVSNDGAIASLLSCAAALTKAKETLPGPWESCIRWIDDRLAELWKMRGPCPGLGAALSAFGIELGTLVAREIEAKIGDNEDPWPTVDNAFKNPSKYLSPQLASQITVELQKTWDKLPDERRALLKLISRLEITPEQGTPVYVSEERERAGVECDDKQILENPYLMYELTRGTETPISVWTVDRGIFPEQVVRTKHPLPSPSALNGPTDSRRVRALIIHLLEEAGVNGHTLQQRKDIVLKIRQAPLQPACNVNQDILPVIEETFPGAIDITKMADGSEAYQLNRLAQMDEIIRKTVERRIVGKRHVINADWRSLLDKYFDKPVTDEVEEKARQEKAAALKELAESRFSVLIGPAGTGKTTLLAVLCSQKDISDGGILLLAPTGKARVKIEQAAKHLNLKALTLAQFLRQSGRYDDGTQTYRLSSEPAEEHGRTVIVDEASMVTEEMLGALFESLKGFDRFIMVGDHRQLPPIGPGRPFVDIIDKLAPEPEKITFPKVKPGYTELTIRRRQAGTDREDLRLAQWFSGIAISPGEDEIFDIIVKQKAANHIKFVRWDTPEDFQTNLVRVLVEELKLKSDKDEAGFDRSLGGKESDGYIYFNRGSASKVESWQILSPVRGMSHGVFNINRLVHQDFRTNMTEFARKSGYVLRPLGVEGIMYGDKVINVRNHHRSDVYPSNDAMQYIANGEIGIIEGQMKGGKIKKPWLLNVEFSSQPDFIYQFKPSEFSEEGESKLELAYALTVHKAQGSEFGLVILVLPNPCRLISRELLYTALTRQTQKVVVLHQGDITEIKKYASDSYSETARRLTNLFEAPKMVDISGTFFEERLINRTSRGEPVRSKSEVIIADRLAHHNVDYTYEKALILEGVTKYPDFTIEDEDTGQTYYWEHLGMMQDPEYESRWKAKLAWYRANGILPYNEGMGKRGILIISQDNESGGISSQDMDDIIKKVLKA